MKALGWAMCCLVVCVGSRVGAQGVRFTAKPTATRDGEKVKIAFAVSAATDVEVVVVAADGKPVRHVVAGLLGKDPPPPLRPDSLEQEVVWDGLDDFGRPARERATGVRVAIGATPRLEKIVGWDGNTFGGGITGLAVGKDGEVYVVDSEGSRGRSGLRVLDRNGKYVRTLLPYPANTPKERTASVGVLEVEDERLPVVFNGHGGNLAPLTSGMRKQVMAFSPSGHLVMASAGGTIAEHGPPRHLLAVAPGGGAPDGVSFVGPQLMRPRGFLGGAGDGGTFTDYLAVSPDGRVIYYVPGGKWGRHGVFRLTWADKEIGQPFVGKDKEPGADDAHLNDPQGVATDKDGKLYVCDRGNNRVAVFDAAGKFLGKFEVANPEQVAVHPGTGEVYVLTRKVVPRGEKGPTPKLVKFAPWGADGPKELASLESDIDLIALDAGATPAKLWASTRGGLVPITDEGKTFRVGAAVNSTEGLSYPGFIAADPARGRVLVREMFTGLRNKAVRAVDLASGKKTSFLESTEVAFDRDGNIYALGGYGSNAMFRFDPTGKPLAFAGGASNKLETGTWSSYGPDLGTRGHCVGPNGDIYFVRSNKWGQGEAGIGCRVDVFGPDGKLKKGAFIEGLGYGDCGIGVDLAGNVYIGSNTKPADKPFPEWFTGKLPTKPWVWWRPGPRKAPDEAPWHYMYHNPYLYHWGAVFKFGPDGGAFYGHGLVWAQPKAGEVVSKFALVANAPAGATAYRSGYLVREVKAVGALWRVAGMGPVPASDCNWGDPSCCCMTSRLAVDEYGRVFVPNVFRFSVEMLDTKGNHVQRIGRYGNADSAGAGSRVPEPEIGFAWPACVAVADGKLYVSDSNNRRVTVVRFEHAAEERCEVK